MVTNYINLDMAGVNWPGGGGAPHGDPATTVDPDGYPKDEEVWPMRVYLGPSLDHDVINQPVMVGLTFGSAQMQLVSNSNRVFWLVKGLLRIRGK